MPRASPQYRAVFRPRGGIGVITALSAYTLFGQTGVAWALVFVGVFSLIGPRVAPDTIMRMFNARPIDPSRGAEIVRLVQSLSERAGLKAAPRLYVVPSQTMNAFAVGTPSRYSLGVTEGLLRRLDFRELAGALAHEITHVRNNDIWAMSLADILSRFTRSMSFFAIFLFFLSVPATVFRGTPVPWVAIMLLYFAPTFSSLLQLALSRSREFDADLGGASLTGDPEGLALALGKLEHYQGRLWEDIFMPGRRIPFLRSCERIRNVRARRAAYGAKETGDRAALAPEPLGACGGARSLPVAATI